MHSRSRSLVKYREEMVRYVTSNYSDVFVKASSFDQLRKILASAGWPSDFPIPSSLQSVTVIGGGVVEWNNQKVSLACMKEDRHSLWLFVIDKNVVVGAPESEEPRFEDVDGTYTATWSQGGRNYLFAVQGNEEFLKKFLPLNR
jgi:hypothetical protein